MGNVHKLPFRWQVGLFALACVVMLWAGGVLTPLASLARHALADARATRERSKPTDPTLRTKALSQAAALAADLKAHPERYRVDWHQAYHPTREELAKMPWGAKGQQEVGTVYSGTLWADLSMGAPIRTTYTQSVGASSAGGVCSIYREQTVEYFRPHPPFTSYMRDYFSGATITDPVMIALIQAFCGDNYGDHVIGVWRVQATAPGATNYERVLAGYVSHEGTPTWTGPTEITANWTIALTGAYRRATVTQSLPAGTSGLRTPQQRTGTGKWYADSDTTVTATCGTATATGNYGASSETDITFALGLTPAISYNLAPDTYTSYGIITANMGGGAGAVAIDFSTWTFYRDSGSPSTWVWRGTTEEPGFSPPYAEGSQYWKTVPSGNSITVHRCPGIASGAIAWSEAAYWTAMTVVPRLWKQNKDATGVVGGYYRYTDYDTTEGHPFELMLYRHPGETAKDVSVAPSWTGTTYKWQTAFGTAIPEDVWSVVEPGVSNQTVRLRKDWLTANSEDVTFTDPATGEVATGDILCPVTFHDLTKPLTDPPWQTDWCTWARTELDLDTPPGTLGTRPSLFTGSGGATVLGDVWTIPAAGGTIERTLATRRRNRMIRFASHQWPTLPEVSHDYPITTRANLAKATAGDADAWWDPEAVPAAGEEPGVLLEDVTDWQSLSCVQLTVDGAEADIPVQMRLTYRTLTVSDPWYLGATYNFGAAGEATASWSAQQTATYRAKLRSATGKAIFDLAPKGGVAPVKLELVEKVEFIFPATAGGLSLTFSAWETVPYDPAHPVQKVRMRNAHLNSDYWGAESSIDGMPNYRPSYGYEMDTERVEVGYKRTQPLQHNPDYSGDPDDPSYLKVLTRWINEQELAEDLQAGIWDATAADGDLKDGTGTAIGTPVWGDYDEDGFCLHVGYNADVPIPCRVIYCDVILQGGVRGIAKAADATRQANKADTSIGLYYSDDGGTTKTLVRQCGTGNAGEYHTGAGREKTPRAYWLKGAGWISLGSFVNAEEAWASVRIPEGGQKVFMFRWPGTLVPWTVWIDGSNNIKLAETDEAHTSLGTVHTVDTTGDYDSVSAWTDGVHIYVDAHKTADGTVWRWVSLDHGETWQGATTGSAAPVQITFA